jgi:hypothetical protein
MTIERARRKLRSLWRRIFPRATWRVEAIGRARLATDPDYPAFLREYYGYCAALFRRALSASDAPLNVVLGDGAVDFGNANRTLRVGFQWEHTLVKPGGRDSGGAPAGQVPFVDGGGRYLARLADRARLDACDAIVDYSRPNLENLRRAGGFEAFLGKAVPIAPLLYDADVAQRPRRREAITLFADTAQPRRQAFLEAARAASLPLANVRGVYDGERLRALYRGVRVLVNVHQTAEHHTFEELRVLPALLCGVVVVSEDVPLRETIPYHAFVVWSRYGDLVDTTRDVLANYAARREAIFGDGRFAAAVARLREENVAAVTAVLAHGGARVAAGRA